MKMKDGNVLVQITAEGAIDALNTIGAIILNNKRYELLIPKNKQSQPTIIKSGDTFVVEYNGIDYLMMYGFSNINIDHGIDLDYFNQFVTDGILKPISEIDITDDSTWKLRPMIKAEGYNPTKYYSVGFPLNGEGRLLAQTEMGLLYIDGCKLATVKDLKDV